MIACLLQITFVATIFVYYLPANPKHDIENFKIDHSDFLINRNTPMNHFWCSNDPSVFKDPNVELLINFINKILKLTKEPIKVHGFVGFYIRKAYLFNTIPSLRIFSMLNHEEDVLKNLIYSDLNMKHSRIQNSQPGTTPDSQNELFPVLGSVGNLYMTLHEKLFASTSIRNKTKVECKNAFEILNETLISQKRFLPFKESGFFPILNIETRLFEMLKSDKVLSDELKTALNSIENLFISVIDLENTLKGDNLLMVNANPVRNLRGNQPKKMTRVDVEEKLKNEINNFKEIKEKIIATKTNIPIQHYICISNMLNAIEHILSIIYAFYMRDNDFENMFKYTYISNVNKLVIHLINYEPTSTFNVLKMLVDFYVYELHPFLKLSESYEIAVLLRSFYYRLRREIKAMTSDKIHLKDAILCLHSYFQSLSTIFNGSVMPIIREFEDQGRLADLTLQESNQNDDAARNSQNHTVIHPFSKVLGNLRVGIEENAHINVKEIISNAITFLSRLAYGPQY